MDDISNGSGVIVLRQTHTQTDTTVNTTTLAVRPSAGGNNLAVITQFRHFRDFRTHKNRPHANARYSELTPSGE